MIEKDTKQELPIKVVLSIAEPYWRDSIKKLSETSTFGGNVKKVIYACIEKGLPIMLALTRGETDEKNDEELKKTYEKIVVQQLSDEQSFLMIKLLSEMSLSLTLIKSLTNSLFNERLRSLLGQTPSAEIFSGGLLGDTPEYLESFENEETKKLKRQFGGNL